MKVSYRLLKTKLSFASKQMMVAIGLLILPITVCLEKAASSPKQKDLTKLPDRLIPEPDVRTERLKKFLSRLHCPVSYLADDFVHAADANDLDWRLLPSISVIESGGGKAYKNNNIFGWDNGDHFFSTIKAGINEVAYKLGRSSLYRNRTVFGKLRLYNPNEEYATNVMTVMNRISPVVHMKAASQLSRPETRLTFATD